MKYRNLGNTGLSVSIVSYGASSLGSVFHEINEAEGIRAVHTAMDLGINYFDVSPYYGLTKAETVLGKAIQTIPRDSFILSTKAGRYGASEFDMSAQRIMRSVDESLARLHTDYVDVLFLHDIEFVPFQQVIWEGIPALIKLKEQGKIRHYGVSGFPLGVFKKVLEQVQLDVILSYCHYALNDVSLQDILPVLHEKNVGVVNASPLAMGLLTLRGAPDWHPACDEVKAVCAKAAQHCEQKGYDLAKIAVQFAANHEAIPTTLFSTANSENVLKNVRWIEEPIDEELLRDVLAILQPIHNVTWPSGLKEYEM